MRFFKTLVWAVALVGNLVGATPDLPDGLYAEFATPHGVATVELLPEVAPLTVTNFVGLAEGSLASADGQPYYTGLKWYRVVPGFVIQSGNPKAPADGDTGYTFADEFSPGLNHGAAGILSMANGGPDTNSAEFFVTLGNQSRLNYLHSVFGRTVRGEDIWQKIQPDEPFSIKILRVGSAANAFKADVAAFDGLKSKSPAYQGEKKPGPSAHFDDPDVILPTTPPRAATFNYKLANFERTTGIRIVARLFAQAPPADEDEVAGAYMRALAEKLGVTKRGAVAAYFAAEDEWRVWISDASTTAFFGHQPATADLIEGGSFHDVKEKFLSTVLAEAAAAFATQQAAAPADKPVPPEQRIKLQADAMLDGLISKLISP